MTSVPTRYSPRCHSSAPRRAGSITSPDDRSIAVSVLDYARHPVADHLYVEDLTTGDRHVEIPVAAATYLWPGGWHSGKVVLDVVSDQPSFGFYFPIPGVSSFKHLDPGRGIITDLPAGSCTPQASLPSPAGFACETWQGAVGATNWSGSSQIWASGDVFTGGASLSTDGSTLAASGGGATVKLVSSPASGSQVTAVGRGYPHDGGWLDSEHVVLRSAGSPDQSVLDVKTGTSAGLPADSVLAARLPGTL